MAKPAQGKTKIITPITIAKIGNKSDITAGDGAKHDVIEGKAEFSTQTTSNVFKLLKECGLPVAFYAQVSPTEFLAPLCRMLSLEVVVRSKAHGSYRERYPDVPWNHEFEKPIVEFYLKTSGKKFKGFTLKCDDPLMEFMDNGSVNLLNPHVDAAKVKPFLNLMPDQIYDQEGDWKLFGQMKELVVMAFMLLQEAWRTEGYEYVDFKVEFGISDTGKLLIADVIDNDSGRLMCNGVYMDKQVYRDGDGSPKNLKQVQENYRRVAALSNKFEKYTHRIKAWFEQEWLVENQLTIP